MLLRIPGPNALAVGGLCRPGEWSRRGYFYGGRGRESGQCSLQWEISKRILCELRVKNIPRPPTISTAGLLSRVSSDGSGALDWTGETASIIMAGIRNIMLTSACYVLDQSLAVRVVPRAYSRPLGSTKRYDVTRLVSDGSSGEFAWIQHKKEVQGVEKAGEICTICGNY